MLEVVVTTGADVQSFSQNVTIDKPTPSFFPCRMLLLSPNRLLLVKNDKSILAEPLMKVRLRRDAKVRGRRSQGKVVTRRYFEPAT